MLACVSVAFTFVLIAVAVIFIGVFIVRRVFNKESGK